MKQAVVPSSGKLRGRVAFVVMCLLAAASTGAQESALTGFQMDTGLLTFFTGERRSAVVTVTELGGRDVESTVRVVFYDASDRVIRRAERTLQRGQPVRVPLPLDMPEQSVLVRASIRIVGPPGRDTAPVVVLEDVDAGRLTIEPRILCAPPAGRQGPVLPNCTETRNTTIGI